MIVAGAAFANTEQGAVFPKINLHIAVVTTNSAGMRETAFGSLETCHRVCDALSGRYHQVDYCEVSSEEDLRMVVTRKPDLVVLCAKYVIDNEQNLKIWLSDFFLVNGIPYTGSDRVTLEFDSNKSKAKTVLLNNGIATAKYFLTYPDQFRVEEKLPLPFPLFIKPVDAANGNGIDENSLVHDFPSYRAKVQEVFNVYGMAALVEEVLPGREFTVAILDGAGTGALSIMPVEIIAPKNTKGDRVLGYREKLDNQETLHEVTEPILSAVSSLAGAAFAALGVRDFGRIDIKLDAEGVPNFIEANLVPGMTPHSSYFPLACALNRNMTFSDVVLKIADMALKRIKPAEAAV